MHLLSFLLRLIGEGRGHFKGRLHAEVLTNEASESHTACTHKVHARVLVALTYRVQANTHSLL